MFVFVARGASGCRSEFGMTNQPCRPRFCSRGLSKEKIAETLKKKVIGIQFKILSIIKKYGYNFFILPLFLPAPTPTKQGVEG